MADPDLEAAIKKADSSVTVLDDKLNVENEAIFKWLRAHELHAGHLHNLAIGYDPLPAAWKAHALKLHEPADATALLRRAAHDAHALTILRRLNSHIGGKEGIKDPELLEALAAALVAGTLWAIEVKREPNRFIGKTDPAVFARINAALATNVDFAFMAKLEGNQWLRGYVPIRGTKVVGKSGVTIATGFDIGQWSKDQLDDIGLTPTLVAKLKPFASPHRFKGMTKAEVVAAITKIGPVPEVSVTEANAIDEASMTSLLKTAAKNWDRLKDKAVPAFRTLPQGWQTVWLSRTFQEGPSYPATKLGAAFGAAARKGDWAAAIKALKAYTQYAERAVPEAKLLESELPPPVIVPPKPGAPAAKPKEVQP